MMSTIWSPTKFIIIIVLAAVSVIVTAKQPSYNLSRQAQLKQLFPNAKNFSDKSGSPPHFKAYLDEDVSENGRLAGYAFLTRDLEPLERGYDGPIQILVGMDMNGVLTGLIVIDHYEPYGYFSIDLPEFAGQFKRKSIRDRFRVGSDIDAVSTATLTVSSAARAVKNSARRIARQLLTPPGRSQ